MNRYWLDRLRRAAFFCSALPFFSCHSSSKSGPSSLKNEPQTGPSIAEFDLRRGAPEAAPNEGGFFSTTLSGASFYDLLAHVRGIESDASVRGIYLRLDVPLTLAQSFELGESFYSLRSGSRKLPITCMSNSYSNLTYLVAALSCTKILMPASGSVETVGLASQAIYMRQLLAEHLGISLDVLQVGKFKGAEEPLTRDGASPEARESMENMLTGMRDAWLNGIAKGRPLSNIRELVEDGPYSASESVRLGLVDNLEFDDGLAQRLKKEVGAVRVAAYFGPRLQGDEGSVVSQITRVVSQPKERVAPVMVLRAIGGISMGGKSELFDSGVTEENLGREVLKLKANPSVKAVVLRIDSPGGSALASDLLWHKLMKLRESKPLVISIGDMAASGGYYLASAGTFLLAEPASVVGSIGVVGGKIGLAPALKKMGVYVETFPAKKGDEAAANRATIYSLLGTWDRATREKVHATMSAVYNLFLERIMEGRKLTRAEVERSGEGRLFSGVEAKHRKLIDELGGLREAVAKARSLASLPPHAEAMLVSEGGKFNLFGSSDSDNEQEEGSHPLSSFRSEFSGQLKRTMKHYSLELDRELGAPVSSLLYSFSPLLKGEQHLVMIPYTLTIH